MIFALNAEFGRLLVSRALEPIVISEHFIGDLGRSEAALMALAPLRGCLSALWRCECIAGGGGSRELMKRLLVEWNWGRG